MRSALCMAPALLEAPVSARAGKAHPSQLAVRRVCLCFGKATGPLAPRRLAFRQLSEDAAPRSLQPKALFENAARVRPLVPVQALFQYAEDGAGGGAAPGAGGDGGSGASGRDLYVDPAFDGEQVWLQLDMHLGVLTGATGGRSLSRRRVDRGLGTVCPPASIALWAQTASQHRPVGADSQPASIALWTQPASQHRPVPCGCQHSQWGHLLPPPRPARP